MRISACIFFALFAVKNVFVYAQDSTVIHAKSNQSIEWIGDAFINSSTLTNNFILAFYNGKFIDDVLKESASAKIASINRLGGATKLGFTYSVGRDFSAQSDGVRLSADKSRPARFSFSFFDRQHLDMKFSDDLFNTIFYGNKLFAGDTASLGNFRLNLLRYRQFRFGWDWKGDVNHGSYGFAFSLLSGDRNLFINAPVADMFTAEDGTFIDFSLAMNIQQTDTAHKKYFAQNGMGLSADFYYVLPYRVWKNPGKITFEVKDVGFIRWNNASMHYSSDSSYHYEGVDVTDIFNLDSASFIVNIDSVVDKNTSFAKKQYTTNTPFTFDIRTKTFYGKRMAFEKGIVFWFNTSAKPYYYAKLHFMAGRKKSAGIACIIGYGAYGRFNAGVEAKIDFAKHYSIHLIENYLFTEISQTSYGMGLYLKLVRRF